MKKYIYLTVLYICALFLIPFNFSWAQNWTLVEDTCHVVDENALECLVNNDCQDYIDNFQAKNPNELKGKLNAFFSLEQQCLNQSTLSKKMTFLRLLDMWYNYFIGADLGFEPLQQELCGGVLGDSYTRIEMNPDELNLQIGETKKISAKLIQRYHASNKCGCEEFEEPCSEKIIKTKFDWSSSDGGIVKIVEIDNDNNIITVEAINSGKAYIVARVPEVEEFGTVLTGDTTVLVGGSLDVAFLIDTNGRPSNECNFPSDLIGSDWCEGCPPMTNFAAEYWDALERTFGEYRAALYSYSVHEGLCFLGPYEGCVEPSFSPCYAFQAHSTSLASEADFINAFNSLKVVCNDTRHFHCYPEFSPCYHGSSVYTALMRVIDENYWQENSEKVIILLGYLPAGLYSHPATCQPVEPISGLTRDEVIQHAVENDIKIMAIDLTYWEPYTACCFEEFSTLASATGGIYYPATVCEGGIYPHCSAQIIKAIEDIKLLSE